MKHVILDFDGVIANSHKAILASFNEVAKIRNENPISDDEYYNMTSKDIFKKFNIRWYQTSYYVSIIKCFLKKNIPLIKIEENILQPLNHNYSMDINFSILSSNSEDLILKFNNSHLNNFNFLNIIGDVHMFSKHRVINKFIKKHKINKNDVIYVGDEVRDIIAAKKSGIKSIAVLWGKDSENLLRNTEPTFIANNGSELSYIIEKFGYDTE